MEQNATELVDCLLADIPAGFAQSFCHNAEDSALRLRCGTSGKLARISRIIFLAVLSDLATSDRGGVGQWEANDQSADIYSLCPTIANCLQKKQKRVLAHTQFSPKPAIRSFEQDILGARIQRA